MSGGGRLVARFLGETFYCGRASIFPEDAQSGFAPRVRGCLVSRVSLPHYALWFIEKLLDIVDVVNGSTTCRIHFFCFINTL